MGKICNTLTNSNAIGKTKSNFVWHLLNCKENEGSGEKKKEKQKKKAGMGRQLLLEIQN